MFRINKRIFLTIIGTTLLWFIIAVFLISYYLDPEFKNGEKLIIKAQKLIRSSIQKEEEKLPDIVDEKDDGIWKYKSSELKRWRKLPEAVYGYNHAGQNGTGVTVPPDKKDLSDKSFKINYFNLVISDMIPLNRSLTDSRSNECKNKKYPELLPTTSVVIVFHNEAWSTLIRTITSVINRSPKELLKEIILVDDSSEQDHLKMSLENYISLLPIPVHLYRSEKRIGLIRARLIGAKNAKGKVLTFLDAHCECSDGWLEPLLARITENRRVVIAPQIDSIKYNDFRYKTNAVEKGGFTPKFEFEWISLTKEEKRKHNEDKSRPYPTAVIAGGLLSIDRDYFYDVGSYDEGMDIWGGENVEMSIRIWQCGGLLEKSPCSHVGHVYRTTCPHEFPGGITNTIFTNTNRVIEVWLDEWKHYIHALYPSLRKVPAGDVSVRRNLRQKLECKSFKWYLDNVYPESEIRETPMYLGSIANIDFKKCIDLSSQEEGKDVGTDVCNEFTRQRFIFTRNGEIRSDRFCLDGVNKDSILKMYKCHGLKGNQEWYYNEKEKSLKHVVTKQCVQILNQNGSSFVPILKTCNSSNPQQKWTLENDYEWKEYFNTGIVAKR